MKVSGFTIIRDGVRLGYPFEESIKSLLPLVDELVVAVGDCTDDTAERLAALDSPKLKMFTSPWDAKLLEGGRVLAVETNKALARCTGDWCFYLQGDEVLHEQDYDRLQAAMERHLSDESVEALTFRYHHFKGDFNLRDPLPYRKQVRIVRNNIGVQSVGDACGFAKHGENLSTRPTGAWVYHYGWVRPPRTMQQKHCEFQHLYFEERGFGQAERKVETDYQYEVARCEHFTGTHPVVMRDVIDRQDWTVPFTHVPKWRNTAWWDGFLRKNFSHLYRRAG